MSIVYKRSNHTEPLSEGVMGKMHLSVNGEDIENIWVKRFKDYSVLQNHAMNLFPFESWGAIIPSTGTEYDLHDMREKYEIELHPEAYDNYIKAKIITPEGIRIPKEADNVIDPKLN